MANVFGAAETVQMEPNACIYPTGTGDKAAPSPTPPAKWFTYFAQFTVGEWDYEERVLNEFTAQDQAGSKNQRRPLDHVLFGAKCNSLDLISQIATGSRDPDLLCNYMTVICFNYWLLVRGWYFRYKGPRSQRHAPWMQVIFCSTLKLDTEAKVMQVRVDDAKGTLEMADAFQGYYAEARRCTLIEFIFRVLVKDAGPIFINEFCRNKKDGQVDDANVQNLDTPAKTALKCLQDWCLRNVVMQQRNRNKFFFFTRQFTDVQMTDLDMTKFLNISNVTCRPLAAERVPRNSRYRHMSVYPRMC